MTKKALLIVAATFASSAALAAAADEPSSYGVSQLGSLKVVSGVVLSPTSADMRGVWLDERVSCRTNRTLKVRAQITISPLVGAGPSRRVVRSGSFADVNCAEGGPNVGFTISARTAGSACPSGAWRPAVYSFLTATTEPTKRLSASASITWTKRTPC